MSLPFFLRVCTTRMSVAIAVFVLAACAPMAYRTEVGVSAAAVGGDSPGPHDCPAANAASDSACWHVTPEVSHSPAASYTLHFVELDDEGWLYPAPAAPVANRRTVNDQIDVAIADLRARLQKGPVLLVIYVHGWKHNAAGDDNDVQKFREVLNDTAAIGGGDPSSRQVVGIYVGWRGLAFPTAEPLVNATFWARKAAALRVAAGSSRELFARVRAIRNDFHPDEGRGGTPENPLLRSIVIGHSFGAQVVFASLSPAILSDIAQQADSADEHWASSWRSNRLRQTADLTVLINPAFEASQYEPLDRLARRVRLDSYQPPTLVIVTSEADGATRHLFPLGRSIGTVSERPFVSNDEDDAVLHAPGFIDSFRTHRLTRRGVTGNPVECASWQEADGGQGDSRTKVAGNNSTTSEMPETRASRSVENFKAEIARHAAWSSYVGAWHSIPSDWRWQLCGGLELSRLQGAHPDLIWDVITDETIIASHSAITGDYFASFLRQLYLDATLPPAAASGARPATPH